MRPEEIEDKYLNRLTLHEIGQELLSLLMRPNIPPGTRIRQEPFLPVETLLTYGLFFLMNPHRYGGRNIHMIPSQAARLAAFFKRTPGSINNKLLNLEGARSNSARHEVALYAYLGTYPQQYVLLYRQILITARELGIDEESLPDFLELISASSAVFKASLAEAGTQDEVEVEVGAQGFSQDRQGTTFGEKKLIEEGSKGRTQVVSRVQEGTAKSLLLIGQEELPTSASELLSGEARTEELSRVQATFGLTEGLTEKLVEQKIRLAQHRFAREVLLNCEYRCVFCGFTPPPGIPKQGSGLLRASHIKPWATSNDKERVDVQNGLTACPIHDVAFDQGYLMINHGYHIHLSPMLLEGIRTNEATRRFFGFGEAILGSGVLHLPAKAQKPGVLYLAYHREYIYRHSG